MPTSAKRSASLSEPMEGVMSRHGIINAACETMLAVRGLESALRQVGRLIVSLKHRGAVRGLADLDERALKDIGLLPSDVHGALAEPFYRDPSTVLLLRSVERRARVRAVASVRPVVPIRRAETEHAAC